MQTYVQGCEPHLKSGSVGFPFSPEKVGWVWSGGGFTEEKKRNRNRTFLGRSLGRFLVKTSQMVSISKGSVCMFWHNVT